MAYFKVKECHLSLGERWCGGYLVTYPVSYRYNGGTVIDGKWYEGFEVAKPKVPEGYELVDIAILLQLNAHPPYATKYLRPLLGQSLTRIKQDIGRASARVRTKKRTASV